MRISTILYLVNKLDSYQRAIQAVKMLVICRRNYHNIILSNPTSTVDSSGGTSSGRSCTAEQVL